MSGLTYVILNCSKMFQNERCNKQLHTKASAQKYAKLNSPFNRCNKKIIFKASGSFLYPFQSLGPFIPGDFCCYLRHDFSLLKIL